jgi:transcriptional regulator with XRE-family HTH domain
MIGKKIQQCREAANISKQQLAQNCGWDFDRQCQLESDYSEPSDSEIIIIAEMLDMSPGALMCEDIEPFNTQHLHDDPSQPPLVYEPEPSVYISDIHHQTE